MHLGTESEDRDTSQSLIGQGSNDNETKTFMPSPDGLESSEEEKR